jgi:CHASE2 domain-containing sensor protein
MTHKLVVLSLGTGDFEQGFPAVTAQVWEAGDPYPAKFAGGLPAVPELPRIYEYWQTLYRDIYQAPDSCRQIEVDAPAGAVTNVSSVEFKDLCQQLSNTINDWLNWEPFRHIEQQLRANLNSTDEIRFIIESNDNLVRRLPWHLWKFFEHYPKAEVGLSAPEYYRPSRASAKPLGSKVKILAILGNSKGIDLSEDKKLLKQLSAQAEPEFLVEPQLEELDAQLWEYGWDILFFAGHSTSLTKGQLQLNQAESITLDSLRHSLQQAISNGLTLAIFNSCDGLDLARQLADLQIPQVIVMREPVPNRVAQDFLRHFLWAFSRGQSLYSSVRSARIRLDKKLDSRYPCASWLPIICQNPAFMPPTWKELRGLGSGSSVAGEVDQPSHQVLPSKRGLLTALLASMAVTALVIGVRYLGILQLLELQAFDHLLRLRPNEPPEPRLVMVTVTENDLQLPQQQERKGSLSDLALNQLLQKLEHYQPRVIGLDIYRDFAAQKDLAARMWQTENLVVPCKISDATVGDLGVAPPPEVPIDRQGFSDFLTDPDGVLRRQLLITGSDPASPCTTPYAFSIQLAFRYLAAQGILAKYTADGVLQFGRTAIKPLKPRTGGYQTVDLWAYQLFLNYRSPGGSPQNIAAQVSLKQILSGQVNPDAFKDRIVLIGTTANSFQDFWLTPYSSNQNYGQQLPGVMAQAQMASQILSAVLDKRPLVWAFPFWGDMLWVFGWSVVGGMLAIQLRPLHLGLAVIGGGICLYGLSYGLLLQSGCWVPLVPAVLALVATSGSVTACLASEAQRRQILPQPQL